jgi:uncharacterized membrane protein
MSKFKKGKKDTKTHFYKNISNYFEDNTYNKTYFNLVIHYIKLLISGIIAAIGLGTNDSNLILGSMLISPLSQPLTNLIYHIHYYSKHTNPKNITNHLYYFIVDIVILFITGVAMGKILLKLFKYFQGDEDIKEKVKTYPTSEMKSRTGNVSIITAFVSAFLAGTLLFNSYISNDMPFLIGIGIATSFLPPLVNSGLYTSIGDNGEALEAFYIFMVSCMGLMLSTFILPKIFL